MQIPTCRNSNYFGLKRFIIPLLSLLLAFGLFIAPACATGVYDLPVLNSGSSTWIVDQADVISLANEGKINGQLKKLAKESANEVRMVIIRRLNFDETIDSFADQLFDRWYPTPEEKAHQTVLVIDTLSNNVAIRRGEAVKSLLGDDIVQSVVSETVAIPLRDGAKYNQAILDAGNRLVAVLSGQPDPGPPQVEEASIESTFTSAEETDDFNSTIWVIIILALATIIPMVTYFWYVGFPGK
nr:TPM domain-containing protein [Gloeothece verrucosa]